MAHMEESRIRRIETLVAKMKAIPDAAIRSDVQQLIEAILELHGAGLERTMEIVHAMGESGRLAIDHLAAEPLVSSLLVLHGIHPNDIETRVRMALDRLRGAELIGVHDGVVRVRVTGNHGSNQAALEAVREAAPDASDIVIEEALSSGGFVPLSSIAMCLPKET
jgi:hypothetical protein